MTNALPNTFCVLPWIHLHTTPAGSVAPCCIAESCSTDGMGKIENYNLTELVNSDPMKQLRLDMLDGIRNIECNKCYSQEDSGIESFRQTMTSQYIDSIDELINNTNRDTGEINDFKMRYFDMRFSNICNFKCRTCSQDYSSQWEQENSRHESFFTPVPKFNNTELLEDIVSQVKYMDSAYFAGGEPLIMEEHYVLLEEMIKQGRTDIKLKYNTNLSNIKFKNRDLLGLWKHFEQDIEVFASVDHVKERAEYIRSGTDWAVVEQNLHSIRSMNKVDLRFNTVLSVFNYLTLDSFYQYLIDNNLYAPSSNHYMLFCTPVPLHYAAHILPTNLKDQGSIAVSNICQYMRDVGFSEGHITHISSVPNWVESTNTWVDQREHFIKEVNRLDRIRNEQFINVFPELRSLLD